MSSRFEITEWDWFKLQVRVYALERRSENYSLRFELGDEAPSVICDIIIGSEVLRGESRDEQAAYYSDWVRRERGVLSKLLERLPQLSRVLDITRDVQFTILRNYGMGSSPICDV